MNEKTTGQKTAEIIFHGLAFILVAFAAFISALLGLSKKS